MGGIVKPEEVWGCPIAFWDVAQLFISSIISTSSSLLKK